jgi:hypothetical protein
MLTAIPGLAISGDAIAGAVGALVPQFGTVGAAASASVSVGGKVTSLGIATVSAVSVSAGGVVAEFAAASPAPQA